MPHNLNNSSANSANSGDNYQAFGPPSQPYHRITAQDGFQPEKEPVVFDSRHLRGAPAEVEVLVHNIREVAQQFLYHWKTFPIVLPPALATCTPPPTNNASSGVPAIEDNSLARKKQQQYHLRDMFVAPSFDELDAVAVDSKGEPRRLNNKQLESIRERG